jgi:hypothetical protein
MPVDWRGDAWLEDVKRRAARGLESGMALATAVAVAKVSVGNPPPGKTPSAPGEPPRLRTGVLRASLGSDVRIEGDAVVGRLGVREGPASRYARALELGFEGLVYVPAHTRRGPTGGESVVRAHVVAMHLAPRPFLRPTLGEMSPVILARVYDAVRGA